MTSMMRSILACGRKAGGLAVAGIVLTAVFGIFNFLAYATTGAVARRVGAGEPKEAAEQGIDGMWLALGLGVVLMLVVEGARIGPRLEPVGLSDPRHHRR